VLARLTTDDCCLHCGALRAPDEGESASRVARIRPRTSEQSAVRLRKKMRNTLHNRTHGDSQDKNVGVVDRKSSSGFVGESRKRFAHENVRRLLNEDSEALGTEGVQTSSTSRRTSRRLERSACTPLIFQE